MDFKLIAVVAIALLASGCASPQPPVPAPGSAASKVMVMGPQKYIVVEAMRVARENGFMLVDVQLSNSAEKNKTLYYRFAWLGAEGFPVAEEEVWKSQVLYASQNRFIQGIAPTPKAVDFRLELKTP
ncbi:YcfL family protein [Pseudomonas retamae]|uniref:YcfL family protein n=1 Tax=Pseudomonas retamae TaxID=702110 RepID=A0ABW7D8E6_9PSED